MGCESTKNNKIKDDIQYQKTNTKNINRQNSKLHMKNNSHRGQIIYIQHKAEILCTNEVDQCKQKVELFLSLINVKDENMEYKMLLFINNDSKMIDNYSKLIETEYQKGMEILFEKSCITDYFFEKEQKLRIRLLDEYENIVANEEITIGRVMGSLNNSYTLKLDYYDIVIEAKNASGFDIAISFDIGISAESSFNKYQSVYYLISNYNDNKCFRKIYKSEEISNCLSNTFEKVILDGYIVNNGNNKNKILFEINDYEKGPIGVAESNINELLKNPKVQLKNLDNVEINFFLIIKISETKNYKFIDLLKMGLSINLYIGIDYTASNGDPLSSKSLHYINSLEPNPYERAIRNCGNIVAYYDDDQKFPVFGFGGIPPNSNVASFCFSINFAEDPEICGIDNVVNAYKQSLKIVKLYGPTNFKYLIQHVNNCIKRSLLVNKWSYAILMIVTDGLICDMEDTIDEIIESSKLPISIIIIGVGSADFYNMNILDGDDIPLKNRKGEQIERDNVQFVEYSKFEGNYDKLGEQVLEEIPRQTQEYYKLHKDVFNNNNDKYSNF